MKSIAAKLRFLLLLAVLGASSSCNTTRGFGEDLQKLGQEIEDEAEETYQGR